MLNLFKNILQKRRYLIVDESNVMDALRVISETKNNSRFNSLMDMEIGNCGWADELSAWFIHFDATDNQWCKIIKMLNERKYVLMLKDDDRIYMTRK